MTLAKTMIQALRLLGVVGLVLAGGAKADPVEDFYKGKTITIIVGSEAGGIYDINARMIARHIPQYLPGRPTVIVQNMIGSGSIAAVNHIYAAAPQDGTVLGTPSSSSPFQPLLGIEQAKFDSQKLQWIGSPAQETAVFVVWHTTPINSIADARNREVLLASTGPNGNTAFFARLFNDIFKTKLKSIYGYQGTANSFLAMQRGEVEGYSSIFWNQLNTAFSDLIAEKKIKLILQFGANPHPDLKQVQFARDLITVEEDRQLLDAAIAPLALGYPYLMGPGVPADRVEAMRRAFDQVFKDPQFLEEAAKQKLVINPVQGAALQRTVANTYNSAGKARERLKALYESTAN